MWDVFFQVADNLGASFEVIMTLVVFMGNLLFFAVDWHKGIVMSFLTWAGVFVWFYSEALNFAIPVTLLLISLVIMAFSLYATGKATRQGGGALI